MMNFLFLHKAKQFFWLLIKLTIVFGCGYFIYIKIAKNNQLQFSVFYKNLIETNLFSVKNLFFLLLFTFFNHFLEITKWKKLVLFCTKISYKTAAIQSLSSLTLSLITPNRIGEYAAKVFYFKKMHRKQILGLNFIGNFYQMLMTLLFGVFGFVYFTIQFKIFINYQQILKIVLLITFIVFVLFFVLKKWIFFKQKIKKIKLFLKSIPLHLTKKVAFLSFIRYLVFSHQFYYLLLIFNLNILYINAITAIFLVYFIASITPMLSAFDVILKGSISVWVFAYFNVAPITILSITTLMWIFNFVLPSILGSYFIINFKPTTYK